MVNYVQQEMETNEQTDPVTEQQTSEQTDTLADQRTD